ncbi:hypothetical protein [Pseudonocardia acidicola]|uniref:Polysaccharide deacetylase n=1 Tax=Pseudonocardia acidicola TaxID=2724939 RepID=A0ABX1S5H4_9PSEU|nr:hypothetical protein [Pseudonocardia acidicola]NMH96831.1 hypothetical protein [Pseudonocardia acidicola]
MPEPVLNVVDAVTTAPARPGYDHAWFGWSPLPARPALRWPGDARLAVAVVLHLGAAEWEQPEPPVAPPPGGRGIGPYPDVPRMSHREFGHRVGVFRLLDVLQGLDVTPAAVVDVLTAEGYRPLTRHLLPAVGEVLAGGLSASRPLTSAMREDEERHYIASTLDRLDAALGVRPTGWLGPEHSESARTPALLAEAGVGYVADWGNDEQPYPVPGAGGNLWSFPLSWELSDLSTMFVRQSAPQVWARSVIEAVDRMHTEGATTGCVLALHLHPWVSGQAFRADAVEAVLRHVRGLDSVWITTPGAVVEHCRKQVEP